MYKKKTKSVSGVVIYGNFVNTPTNRSMKLVSRYPGTMSNDLFEHVLSWLSGSGRWKDNNVFRNW